MERTWSAEMIEEMQPYSYWLDSIDGIGYKSAEKLLDVFGTPKEIFEAEVEEVEKLLSARQREPFKEAKKRDPEKEYKELKEQGIRFIPHFHPDYPGKLAEIPDKPFALYVKGRLPDEEIPSAAIIGARDCSEYGRFVAETFGEKLAQAGFQIISGMARGIDGIAQKAAVNAGGKSFGVLGCGVDVCYPASNRKLYEELCVNGGVLSSYPPGTAPISERFPPRNRIISGLADVVLVVEARQKSGTLITVDMALEQGREVYVVPGRITDRLSDGCNSLILQGAGVAVTPSQLIAELQKGAENNTTAKEMKRKIAAGAPLTGTEKKLLSLFDMEWLSLEQLRLKMSKIPALERLSLSETAGMLVKLSVMGVLQNKGGYYRENICPNSPLKKG